jgi:hypothetical protein
MALSCKLRDFTCCTTTEPHGKKLRGGQIGFCAGKFGGKRAFLPEKLLGELHCAGADATKHLAIRGRNTGISLVDRGWRNRLVVHHRKDGLVLIDKNGAASMRRRDHCADRMAPRHYSESVEEPLL